MTSDPQDQRPGPQVGPYTDYTDAIKASRADLLFLGMTSPKKEVFVATYGARTGAKVVHAAPRRDVRRNRVTLHHE